MKILEKDKVKQLLQIIQNKPGQHIVHFSQGSHLLTKMLAELCKKYDDQCYLYCAKNVFYDKSKTKYSGQPHMHIRKFNLNQSSYKIEDIKYDYLVSTLEFTPEDKNVFLKKCYSVIRSGGDVVILIPKSEDPEQDEWEAKLQAQGFEYPLIIEDLFEHYDVILSKRISE
jgi:phospholipid N-methyltransferase